MVGRLAEGSLPEEERAAILAAISTVVGQSQGFKRFAAGAAQLSLIYAEGWEGDGLIRRPWIVALEAADATEHLRAQETAYQCGLAHDIIGNPFRPVSFSPSWRTDTALALALQMYDSRDFGAMPILADALQDAGCEDASILDHCRGDGPHVRGCWVVDLVLGKE
jgi:hypothetical protein